MPSSVRTHGPTPARGSGRAPSWVGAGRARVRAARAPLTAGALGAAAVVLVGNVDPHRPGSYGACPLRALTGLYCAGCGGLRATYDLVHGDLAGAWGMNPLWVLLVPVVLGLWAAWLARRWALPAAGDRVPAHAVGPAGTAPAPARPASVARRVLPWAVLALVLLYSVARNLPALAPALAP
ncbi:DUF2752 domain-containing protein [Cellulomonas sp. NPDC055163]